MLRRVVLILALGAGALAGPAAAAENPAGAAPAASAGSPVPAPATAPDHPADAAPAPPPPQILQDLQKLYDAGSDDAAVRTGEDWLKDHPQDVDVHLAVVRSLVRKAVPLRVAGNSLLQNAWNHLQAARKTAPDRLDVRVAGCDVLYHLGRRETLTEEIVSYLKAAPDKDDAFDIVSFYAEEDARAGHPERGADLYAAICGVLKSSSDAALNHGTMLVLAGRLDEAVAEFLRSAQLDAKNASAAHSAAQAYIYLRQFPKAEEWLARALALDGGNGRFLLDLAVVKSLTRPDEAKPLFDRAATILGGIPAQKILVENLKAGLAPDVPVDGLTVVADLHRMGYPIYAVVAAEKALRANPAQPEVVLTLGDVYQEGRFWKAALEQYRSGADLARQGPAGAEPRLADWAVSGMARAMTQMGDAARAVELLQEDGGAERFPFEMADALWRSGNASAAMDLLERLAKGTDEDVMRAARQKMQEISTAER